MDESPNGMVLSEPGQPIIDAYGNAWRIDVGRQVTINGLMDHSWLPVLQLAYTSRTMWRQTTDMMWYGKVHPTSPWAPPSGTHLSPLDGPVLRGVSDILSALQVFKSDFDAAKLAATQAANRAAEDAEAFYQTSSKTDFQIMASLINLNGTLIQILAGITKLLTPAPDRIVLDLEHATHTLQPRPSRSGP